MSPAVTRTAPMTSAPPRRPIPRSPGTTRVASTNATSPIGRVPTQVKGAGLLPLLREHGDDHAEDDGGGHRATDPLYEPRGDEQSLCGGEPAEQRRDREDGDATEKHPVAADEVPDPAREQQQPAEGDEVGVDHPCEPGLREVEVGLDDRKSDVDDGPVEDDHQ